MSTLRDQTKNNVCAGSFMTNYPFKYILNPTDERYCYSNWLAYLYGIFIYLFIYTQSTGAMSITFRMEGCTFLDFKISIYFHYKTLNIS